MILNSFKPFEYKDKDVYKKAIKVFQKFNPGKCLSDDKYYEPFLNIIFKFNIVSLSIDENGVKAYIRYGLRNPEFILDYTFKEVDPEGNIVEYVTLFIGIRIGKYSSKLTESKVDYNDIVKNLKYLVDKL